MSVPDWIWYVFSFAFGGCIGSFLNVVIYRLPRDKSLVSPPSSCPSCGVHIRFYDNIPLVSWLVLGGRCRKCRGRISPRYLVIELLTGLIFTGLYVVFFKSGLRQGMVGLLEGGWVVYVVTLILVSGLIAASAIDFEHWVIPISVCWFVTGAGVLFSMVGGYIIGSDDIVYHRLLPWADAKTGALAAGATLGMVCSLALAATGVLRRSYESEQADGQGQKTAQTGHEGGFNDRAEIWKEIVFLLPIVVCAGLVYAVCERNDKVHGWWVDFLQYRAAAGFLGSLWGYYVGCAIVWATRIFGTLGFGREAMGLGDVHLMGAAGAVIGPIPAVAAFFIAPFLGLGFVGIVMFFRKTRQIPYGPFLSLGIFAAIILHDWIFGFVGMILYR